MARGRNRRKFRNSAVAMETPDVKEIAVTDDVVADALALPDVEAPEKSKLEALCDALGTDEKTLLGLLADASKADKATKLKRKPKSSKQAAPATVGGKPYDPAITVEPKRKPLTTAERDEKSKSHGYGRSPSPGFGLPRVTTARKVHAARVKELEAAIPGISKVAEIFSVGKQVGGRGFTTPNAFEKMSNVPFTWIELPGKNFKIGKLAAADIRVQLKALGYGWSKKNGQWATDSSGRAIGWRRGRCMGIGKAALDNASDEE